MIPYTHSFFYGTEMTYPENHSQLAPIKVESGPTYVSIDSSRPKLFTLQLIYAVLIIGCILIWVILERSSPAMETATFFIFWSKFIATSS